MTTKFIVLFFMLMVIIGLHAKKAFAIDTDVDVAHDSAIIINEIYPNPNLEGCNDEWCQFEWIELYNPTESKVELNEYQLKDNTGHAFSSLDNVSIEPNGYLILTDSNVLNNTGDNLSFYGPEDALISQIEFGEGRKGESFSLFETGWKWTVSPTPKSVNVLTADNSISAEIVVPEATDVLSAREELDGITVAVTGTVTVLPGVLSLQFFYIQDEQSGIQIYSSQKDFPDLKTGDKISVKGILSSVANERRIKIHTKYDILIISSAAPPIPVEVKISDIGEEDEGTYVKTSGIVVQTSGSSFTISDGRENLDVVIKNSTGIKKPKMHKGDSVEVSGIISQYKEEYRMLPFKQEDVRIISSQYGKLPSAGSGLPLYPVLAGFTQLSWNIYRKTKRKRRILQEKFSPLVTQGKFLH